MLKSGLTKNQIKHLWCVIYIAYVVLHLQTQNTSDKSLISTYIESTAD